MKVQGLEKIAKFVSKNAPTILTVAGAVGVGLTAVISSKASIKAHQKLEEKEKELGEKIDKPIDRVRVCVPYYIPVVVVGAATVSCIVGSNIVNAHRNVALASAYILSETAFKEYKDKVKEMVGTKQEEDIRQNIAQDHVDNNPVKDDQVIHTYAGNTLFFYPNSDGSPYFTATPEFVQRVENEVNRRLNMGDTVTIDDLNEMLGVPSARYFGSEFGWSLQQTSDDLVELVQTATKTPDGRPCLAIEYGTMPKPLNSDYQYEWWQ